MAEVGGKHSEAGLCCSASVLYGAGDVWMCPPAAFLASFLHSVWFGNWVTHLAIPFGHKGCV